MHNNKKDMKMSSGSNDVLVFSFGFVVLFFYVFILDHSYSAVFFLVS